MFTLRYLKDETFLSTSLFRVKTGTSTELLDDEPFHAVSQMGLVGSTEYAAVKECL